jgi:hypothetical protein
MQVSPQNTKGKSNMVHEAKRHPGVDKWVISVVIGQGKFIYIN